MSLCKAVSPQCPVEATLYGYYPNLGANVFFAVAFGLILVVQLGLGLWKKTWTFTTALSLACLAETIGYAGRLIMHQNPWSIAGIGINVFCLVVAPSFMAAGIYLTLKHIVIYCGPEYSRVRPQLYPWIFILCDVVSILIQAIGGAMGATASSGSATNLLHVGDALIITGIVLQVVTMSLFGALALEYFWRRRHLKTVQKVLEPAAERTDSVEKPAVGTYDSSLFRWFVAAIMFAYVTILIRCIYRIVEMAGGWGGTVMRDEPSFLVLDGMMVLLAGLALTVAHPAGLFAPMCHTKS